MHDITAPSSCTAALTALATLIDAAARGEAWTATALATVWQAMHDLPEAFDLDGGDGWVALAYPACPECCACPCQCCRHTTHAQPAATDPIAVVDALRTYYRLPEGLVSGPAAGGDA